MSRKRPNVVLTDPLHRCDNCGTATPLSRLDAKPGRGHFTREQLAIAGDTGRAFNRLECEACYGPGFNVL